MLDLKCFIFSIFLWLSFGSLIDFNGATLLLDKQTENISSPYDTNYQVVIVDRHLQTNQANWSFKTFKRPYIQSNDNVKQPNAETYDYKLLYIAIGEIITLKLTSRTLIFPFHFFT